MKKLIISILLVSVFAGFSFAQQVSVINEQKGTMNAEIVVSADFGWPTKIIISGEVFLKKAWLGISLYPYGVVDAVTGGTHSFVEVKKGKFVHEIQLETKYLGGSFEVGLWETKVDKVDSTKDYDYWDKMYGFHVEDLITYKSGLLTQLSGYSN